MPRNTRTGNVLELMILPALTQGGYTYETQVPIGVRLGGGRHIVDVVAKDRNGLEYLISMKWQQVSGTAEQKVPFEIVCLADAIANSDGRFARGYLVLGGDGWKLREFFTSGLLVRYFRNIEAVSIMALESFIARANRGEL
jgi:hypothetical protein